MMYLVCLLLLMLVQCSGRHAFDGMRESHAALMDRETRNTMRDHSESNIDDVHIVNSAPLEKSESFLQVNEMRKKTNLSQGKLNQLQQALASFMGEKEDNNRDNDVEEIQENIVNELTIESLNEKQAILDQIAELRLAQGQATLNVKRSDAGVDIENTDRLNAIQDAKLAAELAAASLASESTTDKDPTSFAASEANAKAHDQAVSELLIAQEEISTVFSGVLSSLLTNLLTQNPQLIRRTANSKEL